MRSSVRRLRVTLLGALAAGFLACQPPPESTTPGPTSDADVGSVSFQLTLGGVFHFDSVSYDISGNGFHRAATLDVSKSATFSTVVGGIPFGAGYTATLSAQDTGHKLLACAGSSTFSVTTAATVPVAIVVNCREAPASAPPAVPVPRAASYALGALLLLLGLARVRRATAS